VITSLAAHGYGLAWFEQLRKKETTARSDLPNATSWNRRKATRRSLNRYGVRFSQLHALDLADMDGDGLKDIVTGKRFWAHGQKGDDEPNAAAVLYWFKLVRGADRTVDWIPYQIDDNSGVGTQVVASDINRDGLIDVVVGNKRGTFVHLHGKKDVTKEVWEKAQPKAALPASAAVR
jgi:hypothetical protein